MLVCTLTLTTISAPVFVVPKGPAPRKRKFSTLSDLDETKFAVPTGPAPKNCAFFAPASFPRRAQLQEQNPEPIFVAPKNPAPRFVMTRQFQRDIRGKMRSLRTIQKRLRARIPACREMTQRLFYSYSIFVRGPNPIATRKNLKKHARNLELMKKLERVVIRSVVQGEDVDVVEREELMGK